MVQVSRTFDVVAPRSAVRDYLADFANAVDWDPGTLTCVRRDADQGAPVEVGAQWDNTSKLAGVTTDLVYELTELSDEGLVQRGENKSAVAEDRLSFVDIGAGRTRITYEANVTFKGWRKFADPLCLLVFRAIAGDVVEGITREVEAL